MFERYKLKQLYKSTFKKITSFSTIKQYKYYRAVTAAFLFVPIKNLSNSGWFPKPYLVDDILSIIHEELTSSEINVFNQALNAFLTAQHPRGDWFPSELPKVEKYQLYYDWYFIYGDLIKFPTYLSNYSESPYEIKNILEIIEFAQFMNSCIFPVFFDYANKACSLEYFAT